MRKNQISRRAMLLSSAVAAAATAAQAKPRSGFAPNRLWYARPAGEWVEALPVGNGRLGAMVFGRTGQERLQLNEDTLWAGSPYDPNSPEALAALPQVRALIADGKYTEAYDLAQAKMMARPLKQMPYGTLGDLLLTFHDDQKQLSYERSLDLGTAVATTAFATPSGQYVREVFTSPIDQVIVVRLAAKGPKSSVDFDLDHMPPGPGKYISWDYKGPATVADPGPPDWSRREAVPAARPDHPEITADGKDGVLITGRNLPAQGIPAGLSYAMSIRVLSDGQVSFDAGRLSLRGAKTATLLISAATSYVRYDDVSGDPVAICRSQTQAAARRTYEALKADHLKAHQAMFNRVRFDLGRTSAAQKPTVDRVLATQSTDDPQLDALYFQFARYLLISSSRAGSQPANLQGIWNEGTNPPWDSKYTININTEMNYWPAEASALGDCVEPLVRMVEDLSVTGARTAKVMYGARGWVAHHNTDLWRATAPIDGVYWGMWPTGGAWLCKSLWDHYDYAPDPAFLRRIYPVLKGASQFFADVLIEDPKGRGLITSPSISPENKHPLGTSLCAGPSMDRQIIRDLFDATAKSAALLGVDRDFAGQLHALRARIAPDRIGAQGKLQEWLEDWDAGAEEQQHRHVSHLYAVYPSEQINVRDTPELIAAAKVSLRTRGDIATGWGTAWRACLWARMGDGDHAHAILRGLMGADRTYPNLFDSCPPFQIDGNFGGAAAIAEMLLQSWGGEVHVLPALPSAWPSGKVTGLKARGGLTVDLAWDTGKLSRLVLRGPAGATAQLRYQGRLGAVTLDAKGVFTTTRL